MACSGAPAGATCTVANPITLTSGTPTTFAVSVTTTARSFLVPNSNRQPLLPTPYLLLAAGLCLAMLMLLYQSKSVAFRNVNSLTAPASWLWF